jgi:hypothetical protein
MNRGGSWSELNVQNPSTPYGDDQQTGILEYYQEARSDEKPTTHHDSSDDYGAIYKRE